MNVLFIVFPLALALSGVSVVAFLWAVRKGQFDDLTTPALRVLTDETRQAPERRLSDDSGPPPPDRLLHRPRA